MNWRYYVAAFIVTAGFVFTVLPFLILFTAIGWIWCCAVDGFAIARMTYEQYRDLVQKL